LANKVLSLLDSSGPAGSTSTNPWGRVLWWRSLAEHGTSISGDVLKARVVAVGVLGKIVRTCIQEDSASYFTGTPAGPGYSVEAPGPAFPVKFASWALTRPAPRTTAASKLFIFSNMKLSSESCSR